MQIRGNFVLLFVFQIVSGILTYSLCWLYGDVGLWAIGLFFVGMALTVQPTADEREIQLLYKAGSVASIVIAAVMAFIYFYAPTLNWFHTFLSVAMVSRGSFGIIHFLKG